MNRRRWLGLFAGGALAAGGIRANPSAQDRIAIHARRFEFSPDEISVTANRRVTLVLTSSDFVHGFSMPDFGVRQDLAPGAITEVNLLPTKEGRFHYLCDNFCGDGHDRMSGILVVTRQA